MSDFELQPYDLQNSPAYPKGRRKAESIRAFIRRVQVEEARTDAKNIFAAVPTTYTIKRVPLKPGPSGEGHMVGDPQHKNREVERRMIYEAALAASRVHHPVSGQ